MGGPSLWSTFYLLEVILGLQTGSSCRQAPTLPLIYLDSRDNLAPADLVKNLELICDSTDMNMMQQGHDVPGSQPLYIPSPHLLQQDLLTGLGWAGQEEAVRTWPSCGDIDLRSGQVKPRSWISLRLPSKQGGLPEQEAVGSSEMPYFQ